jgi:hypothetical protein
MPAGGFSVSAPSGAEFEAKITPIVIISCIMAATGGLMFGYDVGISGTIRRRRASHFIHLLSFPFHACFCSLYLSNLVCWLHRIMRNSSSMERERRSMDRVLHAWIICFASLACLSSSF